VKLKPFRVATVCLPRKRGWELGKLRDRTCQRKPLGGQARGKKTRVEGGAGKGQEVTKRGVRLVLCRRGVWRRAWRNHKRDV